MKKFLMTILTVLTCVLLAGCGTSELAEKTGMNDEQEKAAVAIFNANGIKELDAISKSEQGPNMYFVNYKDYGYIFFELNADKSIKNIVYETQPIYADGKSKRNINDILVTNDDRISYEVAAQTAAKKFLVSPDSAEFQPYPLVMRNKEIVVIQGKVTAQNAFGVKMPGLYRVKLQLPDKKVLEASVN